MSGGVWSPTDETPFESAHAEAQLHGLHALFGPAPKRVLDLGCGRGRTLVPLAANGHDLVGIDTNSDALAACRDALAEQGASADLHTADFRSAWNVADGSFDAVVCLGNTFMLLTDVDEAVAVLARAVAALRPGGLVVLDDMPRDLWPELTEGNWISGISPDGDAQLLWHPSDAVFALRSGKEVDDASWEIGPDERCYRMWTDGALALAARQAGLSAPRRLESAPLLVLTATSA